jgi:hypothetical protein
LAFATMNEEGNVVGDYENVKTFDL